MSWWSCSAHLSPLFVLLISFAIITGHRRIFVSKRKKKVLLSLPLAQFLADVFQLHSKSITETFPEIMIKTLASCHFDLIRDILASFSLLSLIKAPHDRMICLCSSSWHHLLQESQVMWTLGLYLARQQHLHLFCSPTYQSHLLLKRNPVQLCQASVMIPFNRSMFVTQS